MKGYTHNYHSIQFDKTVKNKFLSIIKVRYQKQAKKDENEIYRKSIFD